jgi:hypothetical protein
VKTNTKAIIICAIIVTVLATNPSTQSHSEAVVKAFDPDVKDVLIYQRGKELVQSDRVDRKNILLFSLTEFSDGFGDRHTVGVGMLGYVYIFDNNFAD